MAESRVVHPGPPAVAAGPDYRVVHPPSTAGPDYRSTVSSMSPLHLSDTTKERLLASQRRSPSSASYKSRSRRISRERQDRPAVTAVTANQVKTFNNGCLSDSSESMYNEEEYNKWYNDNNMATGPDQTGEENSSLPAGQTRPVSGSTMRTANSLDSLDSVTSCIKQARANSLHPLDHFMSPQLHRINRSKSVR